MGAVRSLLIPDHQRRSIDEVRDRLDLSVGDSTSKRSAFWIMLVLAAVIAIAGVVSDSTATVIGAMIVAPLSIPILGIGLGIVSRESRLVRHSIAILAAGVVVVVLLGYVFALILPSATDVLTNSQVTGRTSPKLMDLLAALATGLVASVALTRRDVGDVLPGVAVAISLVPPLGVVGVCLGSGTPGLAFGAFILFVSNVVALILTAMIVLTLAGYHREKDTTTGSRRWGAYPIMVTAFVAVAIPMTVNSLTSLWSAQVADAARGWMGSTAGAQVADVSLHTNTATVTVLGPADLPPLDGLQASVDDLVPWHPRVVLVHVVGGRSSIGP